MDNVSEHVDITELEVKLKKIDQLQRKIEKLKELLFGLETAKPTEEAEFEEDLYKCETRLDELEVRVKKLINSINVSLSVTAVEKNKYENGTFAQTKIPPIILPTFSGKYEQFSNFKSQFDDLITTNEQLTQSQKLYYLNSCLSNEVKEFASTFDTFSLLYEALESRYDNKRLIVDIHVQQILNFKKIERENPKEIREMIDCIKKNLRALKLLNYEQNNLFNVFLLNIMLKKLDNESRKNFEPSLKAKDVPTFDEFIAFLEQRETILLSVDKNCIVETKTILRKPNLSFKTKTNLLMNPSVENKSCIICKDKTSHAIFRCKKFLELNPEKRLDLVRLHKLCELCLRKNHKRMQCTSTYMCPCGNKHSRSLCSGAIGDRRKGVIPFAQLPVLTNPGRPGIECGGFFHTEHSFEETEFGWIAGGRLQGINTNNFSCYFLKDNDSVEDTLKLFFELESLGIKDDPCYRKDDQAMNIFKETVQYNNNRYVVELPFRKHWNELSNNFSVAKQRSQSLWRRLRRNKMLYTQYKETIQDYLNQGIIEKVKDTEINVHKPMYYLPHQAIKKEGHVTTSTGIVFDAASHQANELSLNDCLWPGSNLNPNLLDVLINFKLNRVAISSDIHQAFLQICLADKHKDFGDIFGINSSPFLLAATIKYHIEKYNEIHPITVQHLDSFMYVDDWITGQDTREEALFMSRHAKNIMKEAGMEMRKWISNDTALMAQWAAEGFDTHPIWMHPSGWEQTKQKC
ncbi:uncharacterized protein TNCV_3371611 [Trichonephila clavipes]|nr:uncharacterized protein TNCV_3371611 [Trichonephila clavipes]